MAKWIKSSEYNFRELPSNGADIRMLNWKWRDFLERNPHQKCDPSISDCNFEVTSEYKINVINYEVNVAKYNPDLKDYWEERADGDCEDKLLKKRRRLHDEIGIPYNSMSFMIVKNRRGIVHAVLCLHTTNGDYILDNENALILPWDLTGLNYQYICWNDKWYTDDSKYK